MRENIVEIAEDIIDEYAVNKLEAVIRIINRFRKNKCRVASNKVVLEKIAEDANSWLDYFKFDARFKNLSQTRFSVRKANKSWFIAVGEREE